MRWIALATVAGLGVAAPSMAGDLALGEIRIAQPGQDFDQYIEITGTPGASVDGTQVVVIGDLDGVFPPQQNGGVEMIVDLSGTIGKSGTFVVAEGTFSQGTADQTASIPFELGDNLTVLLVTGFTGNIDDDVDTDNDGVIDNPLWTEVLDDVALVEEANPNGSAANIAGVRNAAGNVMGLMPHPEHAVEPAFGGTDGLGILGSFVDAMGALR